MYIHVNINNLLFTVYLMVETGVVVSVVVLVGWWELDGIVFK
jgi:hypothetical protein